MGRADPANYRDKHERGDDPFGCIKEHPLLTPAAMTTYPFDDAGRAETSFMLVDCPETVATGVNQRVKLALGRVRWRFEA